ncbi:hypothetical protein EV122DRAFT_287501 [Schizophyllum commune]
MCIQGLLLVYRGVMLRRTRIQDYSGCRLRWVLEGKMTGVVIEKCPRFVMKTHHPRSCATVSPWVNIDNQTHLAQIRGQGLPAYGARSPRQGLAEPATSSPAASHHSPHV